MNSSDKKSTTPKKGIERRRAERRPILATFSIFIAIPKKGLHKLTVHDISDFGIGFDLDIEGEEFSDFPIREGDTIDLKFYLNQQLFIPLSTQVTRIEEHHLRRQVGAEFQDTQSEGYKAFLAFLNLLDQLVHVLQVDG